MSTSSTITTVDNQTATTGSANNGQCRIRTSCDRCQNLKLKCNRAKPSCGRCAKGNHPCVYSPFKRIGRPPKSATNAESQTQHQKSQDLNKTPTKRSPDPPQHVDSNSGQHSRASQISFSEASIVPSSITYQQTCDPTLSMDGAIHPGQLMVSSGPSGTELDMMMQMAADQPWSSALPPWPANLPTTLEGIPMSDTALDVEHFDFDLVTAPESYAKLLPVEAPPTGLPSPDSTHISSAPSLSDNMANAFLWEPDLFGGVGIPLSSNSTDSRLGEIQAMGLNMSTMPETELPMHPPPIRRSSMADGGVLESASSLKRKSASEAEREGLERSRAQSRSSIPQLPSTPQNSNPDSPVHFGSLSRQEPQHGSVDPVHSLATWQWPLPIRLHQRDDFEARPTPITTPPASSSEDSSDACRNECYSALLGHVTELVSCDGGDELSLDTLLDLNRQLARKNQRALRCTDCMNPSTSRATLILMLMALNNLVTMFEQKLNPPEKSNCGNTNDINDELGPTGIAIWSPTTNTTTASTPATTKKTTTNHTNRGDEVRIQEDQQQQKITVTPNDTPDSTFCNEKPLMAGTFLVEGNVKAKFLQELISLALERLVSVLSDLDHAAHLVLQDANYRATRDLLTDLPQRIFFMKGKLALAGSSL